MYKHFFLHTLYFISRFVCLKAHHGQSDGKSLLSSLSSSASKCLQGPNDNPRMLVDERHIESRLPRRRPGLQVLPQILWPLLPWWMSLAGKTGGQPSLYTFLKTSSLRERTRMAFKMSKVGILLGAYFGLTIPCFCSPWIFHASDDLMNLLSGNLSDL